MSGAGPLSPLARLALSAGGLGWAPVAPGTVASLVTAGALLGVHHAGGRSATWIAAGILCALASLVTLAWGGVPAGPSGHGDPGWVVSDEVAGQAIPSAVAAAVGGWPLAIVAFGAFRLFDIVKAGPVGWAERRPGGLGVLLDDLVAGVMAAGLVLAAWRLGLR